MTIESQGKKAQDKPTAEPLPGGRTSEVLQIGSKKELREYVANIEKRVVEKAGADIAALVAINHILRMPNVEELVDPEIKSQIKDLWIKLKATGITVEDPPLLFGLPATFSDDEDSEDLTELDAEAIAPSRPSKKSETPKPAPDRSEDLPH